MRSPRTQDQFHLCLFSLKYAKGQLTHSSLVDSSNIIHQMQSGNRKFYSTESALLHLTDELLNNMDQRTMSVTVLLDMSKTFDSIRHDLMLCKIRKAGVSEPACAWF